MISAVKQQVQTRIAFLLDTVDSHLGQTIPPPRIKYIHRGTNAGIANNLSWTLTFNGVLLNDNTQHFIEHTVAHETAHLVDCYLNGAQIFPHGKSWQSLMKLFNVPPAVTHDYDISKLLNQDRIWFCMCQQHYVSHHMSRRLKAGDRYRCDMCSGVISKIKAGG